MSRARGIAHETTLCPVVRVRTLASFCGRSPRVRGIFARILARFSREKKKKNRRVKRPGLNARSALVENEICTTRPDKTVKTSGRIPESGFQRARKRAERRAQFTSVRSECHIKARLTGRSGTGSIGIGIRLHIRNEAGNRRHRN